MVTPKKGLQEPTMFDVAFTTYFRIAAQIYVQKVTQDYHQSLAAA